MRSLFLSPSLSQRLGGIFEIQVGLAKALLRCGVGVEACGLIDDLWHHASADWDPIEAFVFARKGPASFGYSDGLRQHVTESNCDLLHLHSLWMYPSVLASSWGNRGRKYMVTPNGMLEPWALANSGWKKKIAEHFYERRMLNGAACLQANTVKELEDLRAYGLRNPICVIPNGVNLPTFQSTNTQKQRVLLFLGRLHPKKGLINTVRAWANVRKRADWQLVIAGWDQDGHEADLKQLATDLSVPWIDLRDTSGSLASPKSPLVFTGPVFAVAKQKLLRQSSAMILPSFSEGLPMSVLEAWSYRLPVLMTEHCNLPEGFEKNAAFKISTDSKSLEQGLHLLINCLHSDLSLMGSNGRVLVEKRYTWDRVAAEMSDVYRWILGGGSKPNSLG